jgi:hypothetical protein
MREEEGALIAGLVFANKQRTLTQDPRAIAAPRPQVDVLARPTPFGQSVS